jgi:hypothetical protein
MTEKVFFSGFMLQQDCFPYIKEMEHRLFSAHSEYLARIEKTAQLNAKLGVRLKEVMLDSGAFTAWSKGRPMNVREVIENYKLAISYLAGQFEQVWLINLDVIPGSRGVSASLDEIKAAVRGSDENQKALNDAFGDIVLPVFHEDESWERLEEVKSLAARNNYICISPRNDLHESIRRNWAARVHQKLPSYRTHGLAATGAQMMMSIPWHSVDSASWIHIAAYGHLFFDVGRDFKMITVSEKSPKTDDLDAHYDTMSPDRQAYWRGRMEERGFTLEQLKESFSLRSAFNILTTNQLLKNERIVQPVQSTLFTP